MSDQLGETIERLRDRVRESGELSEEDRQSLLDFSDRLFLLKTEYSNYRHEKLLRHCTIMAENVGGLTEALTDRRAAEEIVEWINRNYENEETNRDYRSAIRVFAKRVTEGKETPDSIAWIPSGTSRNYQPAPNPTDMLHWEDDVLPMIDAALNARDKALIAVAWDSGARSGELQDLSIGDVADHPHGLQITVDGKTGQRTVTLIPSVPYLRRWLQDHPRKNDPGAPLWCKLQSGEEMSYQMFRKALNQAANKADVTKPVTFTNFRKSSASHLASQNMNQAHIEDHHGWQRGSDVAARYVSIFGEDSDRELAQAHGVEIEEDASDSVAPITCPRCRQDTPREEEFCVWCGQALERDAIESVKQREREVRDAIFRLVQEDPEILTEQQRIDSLITLTEEYPDILDDADRFLTALEEAN